MANLIIGFILVILGIMALAAGAFPVTVALGLSGLLMMLRGFLSITGTVLGGTFKLANKAMTTKICPFCKTRIPTGATICPQCRSNLAGSSPDQYPSQEQYPTQAKPVNRDKSDEWSI